jgi:hypothetical protein
MKTVVIRRNGSSCFITVPPQFLREHNLKPGDVLSWTSEEYWATLKIVARIEDEPAAEKECSVHPEPAV